MIEDFNLTEKELLKRELDTMNGRYFPEIDKISYQRGRDAKTRIVNMHENIHKYLFDSTLGYLVTDFQAYLDILIALFEKQRIKYLQVFFGKKDFINDPEMMTYLTSEKIFNINGYLASNDDFIKLIKYILKIYKRKKMLLSTSKCLNEGVACYLSLNTSVPELAIESENQKRKISSEESWYSLGYETAKDIVGLYGESFLVFSAKAAMNVPYYNFNLFDCSDEEFDEYMCTIYDCDIRWMRCLEYKKLHLNVDNIEIVKYINDRELPRITIYKNSANFFIKNVLLSNTFINIIHGLNDDLLIDLYLKKLTLEYADTINLRFPEEYQLMFLKNTDRYRELISDMEDNDYILKIEDLKAIKDQQAIISTMSKILEIYEIKEALKLMGNTFVTIIAKEDVLAIFKEIMNNCGTYNVSFLNHESSYDFEFSEVKTMILAIVNADIFKEIILSIKNRGAKYNITVTSENDGQNIKIEATKIKKNDMLELIKDLKDNNIIS